jgi:uncharacterized protein
VEDLLIKQLAAAAAFIVAVAAGLAPAQARDSYVIDNAQLLSPATVTAVNAKIGDFNAQTHKEVVVVIEPSLTGTPADAEERAFAQQQVNGVLIYVAKSPKTIAVVPDRAAAHYFPAGTTSAIRQAVASAFNSGDFNGGISNGVDLTLSEYRSHLGSMRGSVNTAPAPVIRNGTGGGFNMGLIMWLIALAVIFFIVRGIFRAIAGPRMYPPGYGGGGPMGGPMGGGYGPGYGGYGGGMGMGGGGFWSGMLGGLGGAFLGNELFGGNRTEIMNPGQTAGFGDGGQYGGGDASGFQNDAGQADMGNASSGGWGGDSGGGGWGDIGGGGGDFGGGGGDGGGGW